MMPTELNGFTNGPNHLPSASILSADNADRSKDNRPKRAKRDDETSNKNQKQRPKGPAFQAKRIRPRIPILHYTNDWVCVNKPAGMTVHRNGEAARRNDLVVSTTLKRQLSRKVWPVHRLDHRTSGALLFAFSSHVCGQLHASLTNKNKYDDDLSGGGVAKDYIALVRGDWSQLPETVVVDRPLMVDGVEKESQTEFRLLASMAMPAPGSDENNNNNNNSTYQYAGACSLVQCRLLTGRKHQIRRHAYSIGHPVIGDTEHGDSKCNRWWRQHRGLNRLFLHCLSLDLPPLSSSREESKEQIEDDANVGSEVDRALLIESMATLSTQDNTTLPVATSKSGLDEATEKPTATSSLSGDRIQCIAPLPEELSQVLRRSDMQELWDIAVKLDPRLALEPRDEKGGTMGRGATIRQKTTLTNIDGESES